MKKLIFEHDGVEIELRQLHPLYKRYSIYIKGYMLGIYSAGDVKPKGRLNESQYERIKKEIINLEYAEAIESSTPGSSTFKNVLWCPEKELFGRKSTFINLNPY
ncbi:hypothetical protein [Pedobacter punctiformis]|uniref:Uncharacterized protein n=1 Tax=Pedobacter punctiformis TaxID=3004097 RepID=A0ABT4LAU5_9SPHI|nr:hypothetical protein [Pedobacter sp. HCMS5-2]MCZ4244991.1 hypothetical protein [Pedobacter sp. HCMS5-2]